MRGGGGAARRWRPEGRPRWKVREPKDEKKSICERGEEEDAKENR